MQTLTSPSSASLAGPVAGMSGAATVSRANGAGQASGPLATLAAVRRRASEAFGRLPHVHMPSLLRPSVVALSENHFHKVGILGGMGTAAGIAATQTALDYSQQQKGCKTDQSVPSMTMESNPEKIKDRTQYLLKYVMGLTGQAKDVMLRVKHKDNPYQGMKEGLRNLRKSNVKFAIITCNTAHAWFDLLQAKFKDITLVHIVDAVAEDMLTAIANGDIKPGDDGNYVIGVMSTKGTADCKIYDDRLAQLQATDDRFANIRFKATPDDIQQLITQAIYGDGKGEVGIKGGDTKPDGTARKLLMEAGERMIKEQGVSGLSLSCTELPLVAGERDFSVRAFDASKAQAHRLIDLAEKQTQTSAKVAGQGNRFRLGKLFPSMSGAGPGLAAA